MGADRADPGMRPLPATAGTGLRPHARLARGGGAQVAAAPHPHGPLTEVAHDHFFTRECVVELAAAVHLLAERSQNGKITAAAFRDRIGTGRKLAIQILEFFDRTGMTIREGDLRRLREGRLETLKGAGD